MISNLKIRPSTGTWWPSMTNPYRFFRAITAAAFGATLALATPSLAEAGDLAGNWSGGGSVTYTTGSKEKARCKASIGKLGGSSYSMNARCATASGSVDQSTTLRKVSGSSYSGRYRNTDFNVEGTIRVTQNGDSISVNTTTDTGASGTFSMRRN